MRASTSLAVDGSDWSDRCQAIIEQELARRAWTLADEPALLAEGETFVDRVQARLQAWHVGEQRRLTEELIRAATVHEYCHLLHAAIGRDGSRVQSIALEEAMAYAWPLALRRSRDREQAEAAILRALTQAWLHIDRCEPGSFLAWFASIVINETRQLGNQRDRLATYEIAEADLPSESDLQGRDLSPPLNMLCQATEGEEVSRVERILSRPALIEKLKRCLNNPRREFIIIAQFFLELNASEVARYLAVKVSTVYVEKARALQRIRERCNEFIAELRLILSS